MQTPGVSIDIFNRFLVSLAGHLRLVLYSDAFFANFLHFLSRKGSLLVAQHCLFDCFFLLNGLFL